MRRGPLPRDPVPGLYPLTWGLELTRSRDSRRGGRRCTTPRRRLSCGLLADAQAQGWKAVARRDVVRVLDSYATLLVLLLANFLLLELVDDPRWGAIGSTLLAAAALVVAISDPDSGHTLKRRHVVSIAAAVALAPLVLFVNSAELIALTYLLPVGLLVSATLPVTVSRVLSHRRITHETVLGALCAYVLIGLLFAFLYLAVAEVTRRVLRPARRAHSGRVPLLQLRRADDARLRRPLPRRRPPAGAHGVGGADRAGRPRHARRPARDPVGAAGRRLGERFEPQLFAFRKLTISALVSLTTSSGAIVTSCEL